MPADIAWSDGPSKFRVYGLRRTIGAVRKAGVAAQDLRRLMRSIGGLVAGAARPLAPIRSGKLAASIRPGAAATKATVRAGAAQLPYAGPIHYGWPARHIRPNPFLIDALAGKRGQAINLLEQELDNLLKQTNLK